MHLWKLGTLNTCRRSDKQLTEKHQEQESNKFKLKIFIEIYFIYKNFSVDPLLKDYTVQAKYLTK